MEKRFEFDNNICRNSAFQFKKMDEKDLELLRYYNIKTWDNKDFDDVSILKRGNWVINNERNMILKALGGGSFEIPEMYAFIFHGEIIKIECGGGGAQAKIYRNNKDGSYDEEIIISRISIPKQLQDFVDIIITNVAEAFAIDSFRQSRLNRLSIVF